MSNSTYDRFEEPTELDYALEGRGFLGVIRDFFDDFLGGCGPDGEETELPPEDLFDLCREEAEKKPLEAIDDDLKANLDKAIGDHDIVKINSDPIARISTVLFSEQVRSTTEIGALEDQFGVYTVFNGAVGSNKTETHNERPDIYNTVEIASRGLDRSAAKNIFSRLTA